MQIACKRFGCQKAVEVCYWACKFRRNCKDWQGALEAEPGSQAIRERLESAAAKSGRLFDPATLIRPARAKRLIAAPRSMSIPVALTTNGSPAVRAKSAPERERVKTRKLNKTTKKMTKKNTEAAAPSEAPASEARKAQTPQPRKRAQRPKPATNGEVYLLLEKNGKYKELRESDLLGEAARMLKDPSLRLIKGRLLVPQISLRPAGD
jgi:hypothetical protein